MSIEVEGHVGFFYRLIEKASGDCNSFLKRTDHIGRKAAHVFGVVSVSMLLYADDDRLAAGIGPCKFNHGSD